MAGKKDDKPYLPFYIGDWFKAPEIRAMPHANRMVWFEILCLMWQSEERGYLTINKKPFVITNVITGEITNGLTVLGSMLGTNPDFLQECFRIFKDLGVYSVRKDGAIYSRFMLKLVGIQQERSKAGKKGMEKRYGKKDNDFVITTDITTVENEINCISNNNTTTVKQTRDGQKNNYKQFRSAESQGADLLVERAARSQAKLAKKAREGNSDRRGLKAYPLVNTKKMIWN